MKPSDTKSLPTQTSVSYRDTDVLFGRGGLSNHHPGNQVYRCAIEDSKAIYRAMKRSADKRVFVQSLFNLMRDDHGARFLTKEAQSKSQTKSVTAEGGATTERIEESSLSATAPHKPATGWYEVPKARALQKIRQALTESSSTDKRKKRNVAPARNAPKKSSRGVRTGVDDTVKPSQLFSAVATLAIDDESSGGNVTKDGGLRSVVGTSPPFSPSSGHSSSSWSGEHGYSSDEQSVNSTTTPEEPNSGLDNKDGTNVGKDHTDDEYNNDHHGFVFQRTATEQAEDSSDGSKSDTAQRERLPLARDDLLLDSFEFDLDSLDSHWIDADDILSGVATETAPPEEPPAPFDGRSMPNHDMSLHGGTDISTGDDERLDEDPYAALDLRPRYLTCSPIQLKRKKSHHTL